MLTARISNWSKLLSVGQGDFECELEAVNQTMRLIYL